MAANDGGLEARYNVERIGDTAGKHDACRYFVLDPQHDPAALAALEAYAQATPNAELARDLRAWLAETVPGPGED